MAKVQDLIQQLNALSDSFQADPTSLDRDSRIQLQQAAYRAARSLEDGYDMSRRVLTESPTEQLAVRIGCDLNIFSLLEAEQPQTPEKLNEKLNIEPTILARVLQTLSGFGALKQTSQGYSLAHGSSTVAKPDFAQCFGTCQDWLLPIYQALPKKLKAEEYKLPQTDATDLAVQYAWGDKGKGLFEILGGRPAIAGGFRQLMSTWGTSGSFLYDYYPVEERLIKGYDSSISDVMFVDLGGNWGNKVIAVKDRFPHMPGRLIVQDLPYSIESAPKTDKAELTVHDFFQPQPVKHPRAFHIRQTLHDFSDDDVSKIFAAVGPAMKPGYTRLLLHEQVLPPAPASPTAWSVTQDISMMIQLGAKERTEETWRKLAADAGFDVTKIYYAKDSISESVIELAKK